MTDNSGSGQWISLLIGALTIVATIIAAIPSFIGVTQDRSSVFYQTEVFSILNPGSPDIDRVSAVLRENKIPDSRLTVICMNTGNGAAKELRVRIQVTGDIQEGFTEPVPADQPIWVTPPDSIKPSENGTVLTAKFRDLAPGKPVSISAAYFSSQNTTHPVIDVFFDGKPATQVKNVRDAPSYTFVGAFRLPLTIFGVGLAFAVLVAAIVILKRNPDLASALAKFLLEILEQSLLSFVRIGK